MGKNDIIGIDKLEYQKWPQNLCDEINRQRLKAVMQLNASTLQHYWWLGNDILKKQEAQGWGAKVIDMLSVDLMKRNGNDSGYSIRNLQYMRQFAGEYPDFPFVQVPLAQMQDNQNIKIKQGGRKKEDKISFFSNLCHDLAQPSCTFAEKFDFIWQTMIEGKA